MFIVPDSHLSRSLLWERNRGPHERRFAIHITLQKELTRFRMSGAINIRPLRGQLSAHQAAEPLNSPIHQIITQGLIHRLK
jgi:hypothetical protein